MLAKVGTFFGRPTSDQKPRRGVLDLCFANGEDELRRAFGAAVEEGGRASLCAVLRRCADRPSALSIARTGEEPGQELLPHILMELHTAADLLSSLAEEQRRTMAASFSAADFTSLATSPLLPWEECEGALALLHGGAALFVQLAATPQHRRLLLQHGLPAALQHVVTALADCMRRLGGAWDADEDERRAEDGSDVPVPTSGSGTLPAPPSDEGQRQQLVVLGALEASLLLLGCLWQAGFAAVHAAPSLEGSRHARVPVGTPSALRLPRDVEELLNAGVDHTGLPDDALTAEVRRAR